MKKQILTTLFPLLILAACKEAPISDNAKTREAQEIVNVEGAKIYEVSTAASKMEWIGTKLSTYHHGEVAIKDGELLVDHGTISGGSFVINMTSIVAHDKGEEGVNDRLTGHLLSPDFFDVAKYPEAMFEITGIRSYTADALSTEEGAEEISEYRVTNPNYIISGNLKIKDITKNIEFPARIEMSDSELAATAKFNIDRKLWNITYPGMPDDMIQDMIWFGISLKAAPQEQALLK